MEATADSRTRRSIWITSKIETREGLTEAVWFPKRVIRRCPAIMLAAKRTARVPGRIILLIVSIITINGIKAAGVLWGTRWANICFEWLIQPNNIKESHNGAASVRVKIKCLELVKIYGNSPKKLLDTIIKNRAMNLSVEPLKEEGPKRVLNSEWRIWKTFSIIKWIRLGVNQSRGLTITNKIRLLVQLELLLIEDAGSNTENRLVIIFNLNS